MTPQNWKRKGKVMKNNAKATILIVEDEPFVQMLLADFLNELDYEVLSTNDAKSALVLLEAQRDISLLLTDVGLPGVNGRALAEAARQLRPSLPVIFATGYGGSHDVFKEKLGPGMAIVAKPFEMERLAEALRALLPPTDQAPQLPSDENSTG
jgi:CheY-like chemotaxis protein